MARLLLSASLLALAAIAPAAAQMVTPAMIQPIPGTTDADRLATQMRLLAVNAYDLSALLAAGELSLKLDDLGAAASFFARAEKVDPRNGRAKAGEASILVHAERPGEALRYFALAESYGLAPAAFAADRGLAYDLLGEQERAQRDYRLALRAAPDEETQRRYALSLAIAGKRELAEQQLQPLLRKSDRGAWRAHAFVLALGGNVAEASRIATTMMPPGTAAGLLPFLERLPTLTQVDRAFAVHFGEVRSTPERLADARLVPALPALGVDPYAPRLAAAAPPAPLPVDKGKRRGKAKREPVQVAVVMPAPEPLPQTPGYRTPAAAPPVTVAARPPTAWPTAITPAAPPRVTLASSSNGAVVPAASTLAPPPPRPVAGARTLVVIAAPPARNTAPPPETNVVVGAVAVAPPIVIATPTPAPVVAMAIVAPPPAFIARSPAVETPPPASVVAVAAPSSAAVVAPASPPTVIALATPYSLPASVAPVVATPPPTTAAIEPSVAIAAPRHDNLALARIVAGLPIPAAELGVTGPVRSIAVPSPPTPVATPAVDTAAAQAAERAAAAKALAEKRAADRKAAADKKALAEKKAAAEKKAEEAREAAAQKKLERVNPGRIWVQVAGGANAGDLPKAWAAAKAKGGDLFAGHATGWTTPLRFTNRVLAGPFKTDEEARAFVNKLKPKGVTGFTFTSEAGQVVTKLSAE